MYFHRVVLNVDLPEANQESVTSPLSELSREGKQLVAQEQYLEEEGGGASSTNDTVTASSRPSGVSRAVTPTGRNAMELTDLERGGSIAPGSKTQNTRASSQSGNTSISASDTLVGSQFEVDDFMQRFVFFTLKNGQDYRLSQIGVYNVGDDGFFNALKREYRKGKGWTRRFLSVWKFAYCEFTMVSLSIRIVTELHV
jgi:hypothetical protein